jgi:hypothetical protein
MKTLVLLAFWSFSILLSVISFAQQTAPVASKPIVITSGRVNLVEARIKEQEARIKKCERSGTLNHKRADAMRGVLKSLESEMKADIKKNGKKDLTDDQFRSLSKALGNNAKALPASKTAKPKKPNVVRKHSPQTPTTSPSATPVEPGGTEDLESGK